MYKDLTIVVATTLLVMISALINRQKTLAGLRKGINMLGKLLPQFLLLLAMVSILLGLLPPEALLRLLGQQANFVAIIMAAFAGSITLIPGPIAYPLAGKLLENGVSFTVLATFITTLMMVGVLTFPVERKYLGFRIALIRNVLNFIGALIIGVLVGMIL